MAVLHHIFNASFAAAQNANFSEAFACRVVSSFLPIKLTAETRFAASMSPRRLHPGLASNSADPSGVRANPAFLRTWRHQDVKQPIHVRHNHEKARRGRVRVAAASLCLRLEKSKVCLSKGRAKRLHGRQQRACLQREAPPTAKAASDPLAAPLLL